MSDRPLLRQPLAAIAKFSHQHHGLVLWTAVALAGMAVLFAAMSLGFRNSRLALLNPESEYNQRWLNYLAQFGEQDDVVVVIDGQDAAEVQRCRQALVERLRREKQFENVLADIDFSKLEGKSLYYAGETDFAKLTRHRIEWQAMADAIDPKGFGPLAIAVDRLLRSQEPAAAERRQELLDTIESAIVQPHPDSLSHTVRKAEPTMPDLSAKLASGSASLAEPAQLVTDDGCMGLILVRITLAELQADRGAAAIGKLRTLIAEHQQSPSLKIGLTGLPVLENDEMQASQTDSTRASIISLLGVAILFIATLGSWRFPLLAVAALGVGLCWSIGYATLAVGHLNILSVAFGVILIGLGIDFGIHFLSKYLSLREKGLSVAKATRLTAAEVGPGICTGAATTAIAFFTAGLTHFTGLNELGMIAGGGVLLCAVSALLLLPVLLRMIDRDELQPQTRPLKFAWLAQRAHQPTAIAIGVWLVLAVGGVGGTMLLHYDHNLLNLQSKGIESVSLESVLQQRFGRSVFFALSVAGDHEQAIERRKAFEALPEVDSVEEIASLVPADCSHRYAELQAIAQAVQNNRPYTATTTGQQLLRVLTQQLPMPETQQAQVRRIAQRLQQADGALDGGVAMLETQWQQKLMELGSFMVRHTTPPPAQADLPDEVRSRLVGKGGQYLLRVYPKGDVWDLPQLTRFVSALEKVDPQVTGHPVQTFYASLQMQQSYLHAGIYALIVVAAVLMIDLRSIRQTLLALLPVLFGMLLLMGTLGWLGISLNAANMIVLPLILGIGIDDGIHVVHDYRHQRAGHYKLGESTAAAIVTTSATTMIGFGSMMLSHHQGLQSLGQVLTLGVAMCLVTSLFLLPAVLTVLDSRRAKHLHDDNRETPEPAMDPLDSLPQNATQPEDFEFDVDAHEAVEDEPISPGLEVPPLEDSSPELETPATPLIVARRVA